MTSAISYISSVFAIRGRADPYLSLSRWVAILSVTLGLGVLIAATAAINGVQHLTETRFLQAFPHIIMQTLTPQDEAWAAVQQQAREKSAVQSTQLLLSAPAFAVYDDKFNGVLIQGIGPGEARPAAPYAIVSGAWPNLWRSEPSIVIGRALAEKLHIEVGGRLPLMLGKGQSASLNDLRTRIFEVAAIYDSGMDIDGMLVLVTDQALRGLLDLPAGQFNTFQVKLKDPMAAREVLLEWLPSLPTAVSATDWIEQSAQMFGHIQQSKRLVVLALIAIMVVASFNVSSMLFLMVSGKTEEIAVLRSLGASRFTVAGIFTALGVLIALPGIVMGSLLGLVTSAYLQDIYHFIERVLDTRLMASNIYPVHELVGHVEVHEVVLLNLIALALCVLMSLYPAWKASRIDPGVVFRAA